MPRQMSLATFSKLCERIRDHVVKHKISHISLALHGGEPLLLKPTFFHDAVVIANNIISPVCTFDFGVQTNATLLSDQHLDVFLKHHIRVGVSLDGPPEVNDKYRIDRRGRGSYRSACHGIRKISQQPYRDIWGGILAVIDIDHDPVEIFKHLSLFSPPAIDFLEPDGTWNRLPKGKHSHRSCEYGDWLIAIFDEWFATDQKIKLRKFEEIMLRLLGATGEMEYFGLEPVSLVVIATDGSYESVDQIKAVRNGIQETGMNVFEHEIDRILDLDLIKARQVGKDALCAECIRCEYVSCCGGGYFPHRYSDERGFLNPSVYCYDYRKLFSYIKLVLEKELQGGLGSATIA